MQENILDPQKIDQNGWKQGACLLVDSQTEIYVTTQCKKETLPEGLYVVLSQDCDVLNKRLDKEPVVELIAADTVVKCDPELSEGKNPRQLHLQISDCCLEFFPNKRFFISRTYLENVQSDKTIIVGRSLKILREWIVKRYRRAGFPDEFNRRFDSKQIKKIKQIFREGAKASRGPYIQITPEEEIAKEAVYSERLMLLVDKDIYDNESELAKIQEAFNQILKVLDTVPGIEVIVGSQVRSLDDITVHEHLHLKQWDFDYLSFVNDEEGKIGGDLVS